MMNFNERYIIEPGGFYYGDDKDIIYTLLGSCVAVTLWHPVKMLAGMCHVMLPERGVQESHTRFANCAIKKFVENVELCKTSPYEYEVGIYGGGNMFSSFNKEDKYMIGQKNINKVESLILDAGFKIKFKDVGGDVARKLTLNRLTGNISLEYVKTEN